MSALAARTKFGILVVYAISIGGIFFNYVKQIDSQDVEDIFDETNENFSTLLVAPVAIVTTLMLNFILLARSYITEAPVKKVQ